MRPLLCVLGCVLIAAGCASAIPRSRLQPPARGRPADGTVYVQARQVGEVQRSGFGRNPVARGVTLDVHNRGSRPLVLRLSAAIHRIEQVRGPHRAEARATASGAGELPPRIHDDHPGPIDVPLAAGQQLTVWVLFAPLAEPRNADPQSGLRTWVALPLSDGSAVYLKLTDTDESPVFIPPPTRVGVSVTATSHQFGSGDGRMNGYPFPWGVASWLRFGQTKLSLGVESVQLISHMPAPVHSTAQFTSLDAAWSPAGWPVAAFGAAHLVHGNFEQSPWASRGWHLGASAGITLVTLRLGSVPFGLRLGYTHLFGVARRRGGLLMGVELPLMWN